MQIDWQLETRRCEMTKWQSEKDANRRQAHFLCGILVFRLSCPFTNEFTPKYSLSPIETWWANAEKKPTFHKKIRAENKETKMKWIHVLWAYSLEFEIMRIESKRRIRTFHSTWTHRNTLLMICSLSFRDSSFQFVSFVYQLTEMRGKIPAQFRKVGKKTIFRHSCDKFN